VLVERDISVILILAIVVGALLIGSDQLVKYWAVDYLKPKGSIEFIHFGKLKILDLTYVENDGAIFGSMSGQKWFLIGLTTVILILCAFYLVKYYKKSKLVTVSLFLFLCGGIGNLIDRIGKGYVVDMFEIKLFRFAVFNVADIFVSVAMVLLLLYALFSDFLKAKFNKKSDNPESEQK
jgi:signal peptidase II